jgi:hypothetical protein
VTVFIEPSNIQPGTGAPPIEGRCPKCGAVVDTGFGLAFGGYGSYHTCSECDWWHKESCDE